MSEAQEGTVRPYRTVLLSRRVRSSPCPLFVAPSAHHTLTHPKDLSGGPLVAFCRQTWCKLLLAGQGTNSQEAFLTVDIVELGSIGTTR